MNQEMISIKTSQPSGLTARRLSIKRRLYLWDARLRTMMEQPDEGAATAEYAVVLVAATGFAALLVAILKSDAMKTLLSNIVKKALNVG